MQRASYAMTTKRDPRAGNKANHVDRSSRREFLAAAVGSGTAALSPSTGFAQSRAERPSEKINVAFIGIAGGYGNRALEELSSQNIVAICDVGWRTREQQNSRFVTPIEVAARHPN